MLVLFCFLFFCFFLFVFSFFHFDDFLTTLAKDLMKKPLVFITNIKSSHNLLHFHRDLWSKNIWQWNDSPLKNSWKLQGNEFFLQISAKFRKFETCIYIEMRNFGYVLAVTAMKFNKLLNLIWPSKTLVFNFSFVPFDDF